MSELLFSPIFRDSCGIYPFNLPSENITSSRVFHSLYKVSRNGIIVFKGFNNSKIKVPPVGHDLMQEIFTGLASKCQLSSVGKALDS